MVIDGIGVISIELDSHANAGNVLLMTPEIFGMFDSSPGSGELRTTSQSDNILEPWQHETESLLFDLKIGPADDWQPQSYSFLSEGGNDEPDGGEIIVTGTRDPLGGLGAACVRFYTPQTVDEGGPGDGGGNEISPPNTPEYEDTEDKECPDGAAEHLGDKINELVDSVGRYEFGAIIVRGADNMYGAYENGIHTDYSITRASLPFPQDVSVIAGVIHNHVYRDNDYFGNLNNRYPSDDDWAVLDILVANGADPNNLSVYIVDPWGKTREFSYTDKATYKALTDNERQTNVCLPPETQACGS